MSATDGSAGDVNYGVIGNGYTGFRQPEPEIEAYLESALADAETVLNVGAGAGSYEPRNRSVTAVEPSASMRAQRPPSLTPAIDAIIENLPFEDLAFDASMGTFTVHQWKDLECGLREMRRVTRGPLLLLTCDPSQVQSFWLNDYAPEVLATEARRYPAMDRIAALLGGVTDLLPVPIPLLCRDGFNEAYYGRPEMLLKPGARMACSAWSFVAEETVGRCIDALARSLREGAWDDRYGCLRTQPFYQGSLRLIVNHR